MIEQHQIFMDAGHDEYWSGPQRNAVQEAVNAGVNLAFFSGNLMFWKTEFAPSIDGSNTPNRTLICTKETLNEPAPLPAEPNGVWTGTWADPAGAAYDAGVPQNALTGSEFTVNGNQNQAITVPYSDAALRIWRNTSVASLQPGQVATFTTGTLGFEWDSDVDNGFRPAGEIDLSSTTVYTSEFLLDYGGTYGGTASATNSQTEYRAPSGAGLLRGDSAVVVGTQFDPHELHGAGSPQPRDRGRDEPTGRPRNATGDGQPACRHGRSTRHHPGGTAPGDQIDRKDRTDRDDHIPNRRRELTHRYPGDDHGDRCRHRRRSRRGRRGVR